MKRKTFLFISILLCICAFLCSCQGKAVPDDFNVCFQFSTSDNTLITLDTYNQVMTLGADQAKRVSYKISDEDRQVIYRKIKRENLLGYNGSYLGPTSTAGENIKFTIKFTLNRRTRIISGNNTTGSYQKKNTETLLRFNEYMIDFIKDTPEYTKLINS